MNSDEIELATSILRVIFTNAGYFNRIMGQRFDPIANMYVLRYSQDLSDAKAFVDNLMDEYPIMLSSIFGQNIICDVSNTCIYLGQR